MAFKQSSHNTKGEIKMANDLNRSEFIGRLGADPESRFTPDGNEIVNMRIAVGRQWKDRTTGQKQEATEWVPLVVFGKLAGVCSQYLSKGSRIYVSGEFRTRQWEKDGVTRYTTEIVVSEMQMLDSRNPNQQAPQQNRQPTEPHQGQYHGEPASSPQQYQQPAQQQPAPGYAAGGPAPSGGFDDFDDDIPFTRIGPEVF